MPNNLKENNFAFFCVADGSNYVPKAITALASVRRFHPDSGYFILGRFSDDAETLALINQHGIKFEFLDLSDTFKDCKFVDRNPGNWPSECFWWTYAYEIFSAQGYKFSSSLDGDVMCVNPINFNKVITEKTVLSGVEKRNGRINSGVLFFNNAKMKEARFFEKIVDIYENERVCDHNDCQGYCREKGDQGLLWEVDRLYGVSTHRIENAYNHMLELAPAGYLEKNPDGPISIENSKLLHILFKPWRPLKVPPDANSVAVEGYNAWWEFAEELWPDAKQRMIYFGAHCADLS